MNDRRQLTYYLHKLVFVMDKMADKDLLEKIETTYSQFKILMAIDCHELSQREVAEYWNMTEAAVSRQVELLTEKKLVKVSENPENRRCNTISLTPQGKKILKKGFEVIDKKYEEIYRAITQKEQEQLEVILEKLVGVACPNKILELRDQS